MKLNYKATLLACCIGYIIRAIVNNLTPLLFLILRIEFGISYEMMSQRSSLFAEIGLGRLCIWTMGRGSRFRGGKTVILSNEL